MANDLNEPMTIPALPVEGGEEELSSLPGGMSDEAFIQGVNAGHDVFGNDEPPTMSRPSDLTVTLPVPLEHPEHGELTTATIRELTGADEEFFAKGRTDAAKMNKLVERGTEDIDGVKVDARVVLAMPIGNRDALMLGIRRATYGDDLDLDLVCRCGAENPITINLAEEIEVRKDGQHAVVPFRRGGSAKVRWPNPGDEKALLDASEKNRTITGPELNTILLGRVLVELNGEPAFGEVTARSLRMSDRGDLVLFLTKNQPGPLLDEVTHKCVECGRKSPVEVGYRELFR